MNEITGVDFLPTTRVIDHRGDLSTIYQSDWAAAPNLSQWNIVRSTANVLRGVHAHCHYAEFYVPVAGEMFLFLKDARRSSPTFGAVVHHEMNGADGGAVLVPIGVAHGVLFKTAGILAYGLSAMWTGRDEFGCRWNDPALGADWPIESPTLSERDEVAGSYETMVVELNAGLDRIG